VTAQDHGDVQLFADDLEAAHHPCFAAGAEAIQERATDIHAPGAERQRFDHVLPGPDAAIHVDFDPAPDAGDDVGQRRDARGRTIIVLPYAKKRYIDHTQYDTASILRLITHRFGLQPLPGLVDRDQKLVANGFKPMGEVTGALDFSQK
jgi:hypothetical protein